jgi:biopolymer transport protein TolQ
MFHVDTSIISYFYQASLIVKLVMLMLVGASLLSWFYVFERRLVLKAARKNLERFESEFWGASDLAKLYEEVIAKKNAEGLELIFIAGFGEFVKLQTHLVDDSTGMITSVERAMHVAYLKMSERLEKGLSSLATIGSTSPYVGLFGTVWGIMAAFQALGHVSQATIDMVAPGISEALVATAMGLFAAIPAVIAYNRYRTEIDQLLTRYESFQEAFASYLYRHHTRSCSK